MSQTIKKSCPADMCGWTGHIQDSEAELLPAAETSEAELGQRSAFCKPAATGAAKAGNRNHQGEGISVPRMRAEMGIRYNKFRKMKSR